MEDSFSARGSAFANATADKHARAGWAGSGPAHGEWVRTGGLIRHGVAVAAGVGAGDAVAAGRLDQNRGGAAGDAERLDPGDVVAARLQIVVDGIGDSGFDVQLVEARIMRPERAVEVQRLHPRPFEGLVQIGEPIGPELDDVEERLKDGLVLVVAARRADGHEGLTVLQDDAGRERVARAGARTQLRGARSVEPELLAPHAHADAGVAENDGAADPAAARGRVEDVAVLVDDGDMGRVLDRARDRLGIDDLVARLARVFDVGNPIGPAL